MASTTSTASGVTAGRANRSGTTAGCRCARSRADRPSARSRFRQGSAGSGRDSSASRRPTSPSSRSSLLLTCGYSAMAVTPILAATVRMVTASRPCSSAMASAAPSICSRRSLSLPPVRRALSVSATACSFRPVPGLGPLVSPAHRLYSVDRENERSKKARTGWDLGGTSIAAERADDMASPAEQGAPVLDAEGLVKTYGRRRALDGFTLSAAAGEIVGLVGQTARARPRSSRWWPGWSGRRRAGCGSAASTPWPAREPPGR